MQQIFTRHLFFVVVSILCLPAVGMAKNDTIRTKDGVDVYIKKNQSKKLKFIGEARLLDIESGATDPLRIGAGVSADYLLPKIASANVSFKGAYYSLLEQFSEKKSKTDNKLNIPIVANAGIRLHIYDGKGKHWRKINIQKHVGLNDDGTTRTTVRFLKAKYPCRLIYAARGGVYFSTSPVVSNMNKDIWKPEDKGSIRTTDGTVFGLDHYTNSTTTGFYVGLSRIINMRFLTSSNIEVDESERKLTSFFKETYLDILIANTTFDPFQRGGLNYEIVANADGSFSTNNVGWRLGSRLVNTKKKNGMGAYAEIGMRPGVFGRGMYASLGFNLAFTR